MIRQSRERPSGELELLIRPLKNCHLNNDNDSENAYDNNSLNLNSKNPLIQSLETLRDDLTTGHLIEQYEVSYLIEYYLLKIKLLCFLDNSTTKRWIYIRNWY
jgi:hypothetical protein